MRLTTLSSWLTLLMVFALVVLVLWISHERLTRGNGTHRADHYDNPWEVLDDDAAEARPRH